MKRNFLKITLALVIAFATFSCDKDFNSVGSDIIGEDHFNFEKYEVQNLVAYSKATGAVQSNNLPVNAFGIYDNPAFGTTKANFVTQVELAGIDEVVGTNIEIKANDSVYLYIPYFSRVDKVVDGENIFILDSIYGNQASTMSLKVYENAYILRDFNPNPDPNDILSYYQRYFSNEKGLIENNLNGTVLNNSTKIEENSQFIFNKKEIIKYKTDEDGNFIDSNGVIVTDLTKRVVKDRKKPGMWLSLDKDFFKTKVLMAAPNKLTSNTIFKEYFRGLYFKMEQNPGEEGLLAMMDFSKGKIVIQYHSDVTTVVGGVSTIKNSKKEYSLNLKGNTINFYDYENDAAYQTALASSNAVIGDSRLYLKGGNGSVAYIDLFGADQDGNDIADELEELRNNNWLINEASLTFYIDKSKMNVDGVKEPKRIYLYDATNNLPILDYSVDNSTTTDLKNNKFNFDGIIKVDENKKGIYYRIRLTNYINRVINSEDASLNKNIRLGLSLTENINISTNGFLTSPISLGSQQTSFIPISSVMNPLGTVLYGSNVAPINEDKKLKLQIFYTKPN
ncbi:DUF4270 domain-containing protein [Flavobacterium psychraquaticum]|uniref:DUF4270 domain-containing protein n=1 Tax=Flavobacterium psychraquaticum TaxID=3103958 RepID=UPI002ACDD138|nr:DUF4270 domain-containing protein [Flavobacterium sp. LB-N7T]